MRSENDMIAYALEVEAELLPLMPELLADLDELGCDAELLADTVAELELPKNGRVLDLGCGKGAAAMEIARKTGLAVAGVDLFQPFIDAARQSAAAEGLDKQCNFIKGDILKLSDQFEPVDVVVFAALGDVLGPFDVTMGILRKFVKPGGYIIVNDDYVREGGSPDFKRWEGYVSREEMVNLLQSQGDIIIKEIPEEVGDMTAENEQVNQLLRQRAQGLALQHPHLEAALNEFLQDQIDECAFMEKNMVPVVWVIRRVD